MATKKQAKKATNATRRKKNSKAGKMDIKTVLTIVIGAILALFASPVIARRFPTFSKYSGPMLAGVGLLLARKTKGSTRLASVGVAVGGAVLAYQSYSVSSEIKQLTNGPARLMNGPSKAAPYRIINGPSRVSEPVRNPVSNFGNAFTSGAPVI